MLKKLWNDPVWSKVIAGTILGGGALLGSYFLNWWPIIGRFTTNVSDFTFLSTSLPNWVIGFLCLLAVPSVVVVAILVWQSLFPSSSNIANWRHYRTDILFGLRWRWNYFDSGLIYDCIPFAPIAITKFTRKMRALIVL